jgi:glutamate synthase (NADPH/NADH) large chain
MNLNRAGYEVAKFSLHYNPEATNLKAALTKLCEDAAAAVKSGKVLVVLSDNDFQQGVLPIHALLAVGAVNQHLTAVGLRCDSNIIIETGTARDPHQVAALIAYGATAVYPFLSYYVLNDLIENTKAIAKVSTKGCSKSCQRWVFRR